MAKKKKKGMTTLEVVRAISQAASKSYDGYDGEGERIKAGLKREEGNPLLDKRVMDGFGVKFSGDKLCVTYHGEVSMKDLHRNGPKKFENEMEQTYKDIVKFIKKEYKKDTGKALALTSQGDADSLIQRMNSIRNWVQSSKWYKIGGIDSESVEPESERTVDDAIKKFLSLSSKKKSKNVTRKQPDRPGLGEIDKG